MYFKRMINDFKKNGGKVYPMEEECINQILGIYGYLPKAYIEFLKTMGNGTGERFLSGYSCFSKEIFNLNDWAMEILYENENTELLRQYRTKTIFWILYASCLHIFRHIAQKLLDGRQPACVVFVQSDEKSDGAICAQSLCGIALNKSDYVFMMMQGIVFWYFDLNDGDDPPVYGYDEYGSVNGQIVCNHFSIFINNLYHTLEKR